MERGRLQGLDGLRGIAAAGVGLHHIFYHFASWQIAVAPLTAVADWLKTSGWTLVDLFFVLSGYVFAHVYLREDVYLRDDGLSKPQGFADFWVARVARLYPLHLVTLLIVALITLGNPANTATAFLAHLGMAQAFVSPVAGTFNQASWSISIEMVCYLIFSLTLLAGRRVLIWTSVLLIFIAAEMLWLTGSPGGPWADDVLWRGLLGFFLGQCLWQGRDALARIPGGVLVMVFCAGIWLQHGSYSPLLPLTLLSWPAALLLCLRLRVFAARPMQWLGDRSYAIYLVNLPIITGTTALMNVKALNIWQIMAVQLSLALAILLASEASYRWLEKPARRSIRQAWSHRRAARVTVLAPTI